MLKVSLIDLKSWFTRLLTERQRDSTVFPTLAILAREAKVDEIRKASATKRTVVIASAGWHQMCLPMWQKQSSARVYARYVSSEILWGLKSQKFSWSLLACHLYTKQLFCKPETVAVRNGTKNDQFSRSKVYIQKHTGCYFC